MKKNIFLLILLYILINGISANAQTTETDIIPVYNGNNGLLEKVIRPKCNGCHSSERTGGSRNEAPDGMDFDSFEGARQFGNDIVKFAVERMSMPPNNAQALSEIEKQAIANWRLLGFPETTMPTHYLSATNTLEISEVFIFDATGNVTSEAVVEMKLIEPFIAPFRFEIQQLNVVAPESSNN